MPPFEEKKITIRLPRVAWPFFLILFFVSILLIGIWYWSVFIRPYLWLSEGRVEAMSAVILSDAEGRIVELGLEEGDWVKKGESLFTYDSDFDARKRAAAKKALDALNLEIEREKNQIGKAMEEYLAATNELQMGIGSAEKVKKQLAKMDEAQEKSEKASAQVMAVQSELGNLEMQLKQNTVFSPFEGQILKKLKNIGSIVSFGDPVYLICDTRHTWIESQIPEKQIGHIQIGTPAKVQLLAYPNKEFLGKVSYIGPATVSKSSLTQESTKEEKICIKISLDNSVCLRPGLSARAWLKVH